MSSIKAARLLKFTYVERHELDAVDIDIPLEVFPFVTPTPLLQIVVEKDQNNIAPSNADAAYDLWAFWHDNRREMPAWYDVAKDVAFIQPSSAFIERVFSSLRACMDDRQEQSYSDHIPASALLKYNRDR